MEFLMSSGGYFLNSNENVARIPLAQKRWNQNLTIDFFAYLALNLKLSSQISRGILKSAKKNPQCVVRTTRQGRQKRESFYDFRPKSILCI